MASHLACLALALAVPPALAQSPAQPLQFEIASVKPSPPEARISNVIPGPNDSLTIENVPLRKIITYAYDLRGFQLSGDPGWLDSARYDIVARSAAHDPAPNSPVESDAERRDRVGRVRERLRSLLSDRFALRMHFEQKEQTVLELRIAKSGPRLAATTIDAAHQGRVSTIDGRIQGFGAPVALLVTQLSLATGLIVHDETGLAGKYDFVLEWAPDENDQHDTRPSLFTAVSGQLGLRLERAKGLVKAMVIDHIERPSAN